MCTEYILYRQTGRESKLRIEKMFTAVKANASSKLWEHGGEQGREGGAGEQEE